VREGPALGDEVLVPTQQGCWLDEEAPESPTGEQSREPRQHRSICWLQRRSVDLAPEDCQLVAQHDDFDGEIRATATDQSDDLKDTAERPVQERGGHRRMLAADGIRRQSPGHSRWMAFSAPTRSTGDRGLPQHHASASSRLEDRGRVVRCTGATTG